MQFAEIIQEAFDLHLVKPEDLATEFEVAISTVHRWAKGTSVPHTKIRSQVLEYLIKRTMASLGRDVENE